MALFLSALMSASAHAAPIRTLGPKPAPEVRFLAEAWKQLLTWLQGHAFSPPGSLKSKAPDDTSHIDPNGIH
jgi:hypothetical protein